MMSFDPRLKIELEAAEQLESRLMPLFRPASNRYLLRITAQVFEP
jgi:hypothetical protein